MPKYKYKVEEKRFLSEDICSSSDGSLIVCGIAYAPYSDQYTEIPDPDHPGQYIRIKNYDTWEEEFDEDIPQKVIVTNGLWNYKIGSKVINPAVITNPDYTGQPEFITNPDYVSPTIPNPDYDPNNIQPEFITNPEYVSPTIYDVVSGTFAPNPSYTGQPYYLNNPDYEPELLPNPLYVPNSEYKPQFINNPSYVSPTIPNPSYNPDLPEFIITIIETTDEDKSSQLLYKEKMAHKINLETGNLIKDWCVEYCGNEEKATSVGLSIALGETPSETDLTIWNTYKTQKATIKNSQREKKVQMRVIIEE